MASSNGYQKTIGQLDHDNVSNLCVFVMLPFYEWECTSNILIPEVFFDVCVAVLGHSIYEISQEKAKQFASPFDFDEI